MDNKKRAFTLAELLVAMLIFAVVASMLIPNIAQNAEKSLFFTQIKKVQNDVQQALLLMMSENQGTLQAYCLGQQSNACFIGEVADRLETKVTYTMVDNLPDEEQQTCENNHTDEKNACIQKEAYLDREPVLLDKDTTADFISAHSTNANPYRVANLTNGASISVVFNPKCNFDDDANTDSQNDTIAFGSTNVVVHNEVCGFMEIDINASKAPNTVGKDIHYFWIIDKDGLVPFGEIDDTACGNNATLAIGALDSDYVRPATSAATRTIPAQLGCTFKLFQDGRILYY